MLKGEYHGQELSQTKGRVRNSMTEKKNSFVKDWLGHWVQGLSIFLIPAPGYNLGCIRVYLRAQ